MEQSGWITHSAGSGMTEVGYMLPIQPQELELLGTIQAALCFLLNFNSASHVNQTGFNATSAAIYGNSSFWCNFATPLSVMPGHDAISLSINLCLICGDRTWKGTPGKANREPCTVAQLTLFHPTNQDCKNMTIHYSR